MHKINWLRWVPIALLTLLGGFLAPAAWAASSDGAFVQKDGACNTDEFGTFCFQERIVFNQVETGSGNIVGTSKSELTQTFTSAQPGGCNFSFNSESKFHVLFQADEPDAQENHNVQTSSTVFDCPNFTLTCTTDLQAKIVNGVIKFFRNIQGCVTTP
jgi:hypothetical protein